MESKVNEGSDVKFQPLNRKAMSKYLIEPVVDVDSFAVVFDHLGAYKTNDRPMKIKFGKNACFAKKCENIKLLDAYFSGKGVRLEFTLQDPSSTVQPIYVLISYDRPAENSSSSSSDDTDTDPGDEIAEVTRIPWRQRFLESFIFPAFGKLRRDSRSVVHCGDPSTQSADMDGSIVVYPEDYEAFSNNVFQLMNSDGFENVMFIFYTATHGLQLPVPVFRQHIVQFHDLCHLSIRLFQVHVAVTFTAHSKSRVVKCVRQKLLSVFKNPTIYCAHLVYDQVYFRAKSFRAQVPALPFMTYVQAYDPGVHRVRLSNAVSPFVWAVFGGPALLSSRFETLRALGDTGNGLSRLRSYCQCCLEGPSLRFEMVFSNHSPTQILGLLPSYGQRLVDFVVVNELLSISNTQWPLYINSTFRFFVDSTSRILAEIHKRHFTRNALAELYDVIILMHYFISGSTYRLDNRRTKVLVPAHQTHVGSTAKVRRNQYGFISVNWTAIGQHHTLDPSQVWEHLPLPNDRKILVSIFNSLGEYDLISCTAEECANWWIYVLGTYVANACEIAAPSSWNTCFRRAAVLRAYDSRSQSDRSYVRLSVDGLLPPSDVLACFLRPTVRVTDVVRLLISLREDFDDVVSSLTDKIEAIEVFPLRILSPASTARYYDWVNVGKPAALDAHVVRLTVDQIAAEAAGLGTMERR